MESKSKILIVILLVVIAVLGYAIYSKKNSMPSYEQVKDTPQGSNNTATPPVNNTNGSGAPKSSIVLPGPGATAQDFTNYYNQVSAKAVAATSLSLKGCVPTPEVAKFKKGTTFKINNTDSVVHTFSYRKDINFEIAANSSKELKISEPGIYPYYCDDVNRSKATGFLMVTGE